MTNRIPQRILHDENQVTTPEDILANGIYLEMRRMQNETLEGRKIKILNCRKIWMTAKVFNQSGGSHTEEMPLRCFGIVPYSDGTWEAENYLVPSN